MQSDCYTRLQTSLVLIAKEKPMIVETACNL
jgi:hypothetical protein